jgi:steroid delta-isomerase-like uncharacterized protein
MPAGRNSLILSRLYEEVLNEGNLDMLPDLYTASYVNHAAPFGLSTGVDGLRILFREFQIAFPDQHIVGEEWIEHEDRVVCRWRLTGTHLGPFFGIPATGRPIVMTGIDIERIEDGLIAEHWGGEDMLGVLQQVGAIPRSFEPSQLTVVG